MMKRLVLLVVLVMILSVPVVLADDEPSWTVDELIDTGCDDYETQFIITHSNAVGKGLSYRTTVDAGGDRYMNEAFIADFEGGSHWSLYEENNGGPIDGTWPLPADTNITVNFIIFDSTSGDTVFQREVILSRCNGGSIISDQVVSGGGGGAGEPCGNVSDGRLNNDAGVDCAAPLAVYDDGTTLTIYAVNPDNGSGALAISLTHAEIDAAGIPTDGSAVLAATVNPFTGQALTLYRLVSGELQLNAQYPDGKPYSIVWAASDATGVQHLSF